jgi:O-antigen/teichoic acid export membrane protein
MTNRQRVDAANALLFFIISPLIQLLFARWLGWIGVAIGVLATVVIINSLQVIEIRHFYRFHPFQRDHLIFTIGSIVIVVLAAFISQGFDLPFRIAILGGVLVGFLIYVYIQRTPNDIMFFEMLLPKRKLF